MNKGLVSLLLGGLGIGITEFVMMGLLPVLANHFHVSIPSAGNFITFYALGVVVGAPILVLIAGRYPPKTLLIILMVLFTVFNGLSAFAPTYTTFIFCRFLAGLPHGAFFGVGAVVASRIAQPGKQARAVAIMFSGLTLANVVGVPLGTYLGFHFSWRLPFVLVTSVGVITLLSLFFWLPNLAPRGKHNIAGELSFFTNIQAWLVMLIICIGTSGLFSWFSYIAPLLTHISHFHPGSVAYIMVIAGAGMLVGNLIGGRLSDHSSPIKATSGLLVSMAIILLIVHFTAFNKPMALIMTFLTGANAFAMASPIQMMMIRCFSGSEMLASAISQACFNIGNALGAFLGGLPMVYGYAYNAPELVGAGMVIISLFFMLIFVVRKRNAAHNESMM